MVDDMRRDLGHPGIHISRAEKNATGEPSFTYQTLSMLRENHPIRTFYPLLGGDIVADTSKWKDWDNLVEEFPPIFVNRAGAQATFPGPTFPFMSSTLIRERFKLGQSIEGLLTRRVMNYVEEHGLYR